jgi:hypothetical protein
VYGRSSAGACLALLAFTGSAVAQSTSTDAWQLGSLTPSWIRFSGLARVRLEAPSGHGLVAGDRDGYLLSRVRLNVAVTPASWLKFTAEMQDTRAAGHTGPAPAAMQNPADLRLAYFQLGGEGSRASARVGRQDVHFGAGRLIGLPDWGNSSRTFDVIRSTFAVTGARFEVLAGSVVYTDGTRFDRHKPGEHVYASYNTFDKLIPGGVLDLYFIVKTADGIAAELGSIGNGSVYSSGGRTAGKLPNGFDYSAELVRQWGSWSSDGVSATAGTYTAGWTAASLKSKPRLSADYSHASGDASAKDGRRGTFDALYGTHQPFYSITPMFAWRNARILRTGVAFLAAKNVKVTVDGRDYRLATVQDGLYNASAARSILNRAATSTHVGHGIDAQVAWTLPEGLQLIAGGGKIFAGTYLKQSGKGNYLYPVIALVKRF